MAQRPSPTLPSLHPRYDIVSRIGEGGMAQTYKARDLAENRWVALKSLPASASEDDLRRFRREFEILYPLRHPNLPQAFDLITTSGGSFFTMELIEGQGLDRAMASGSVTAEWLWRVLTRILAALDHLHRHRVIHGDLKPANILMAGDTGNPVVKVIDFGLAASIGDIGEVQGTIQYTAPEIIKKEKFDFRADLYSLGVVLYEMLSGSNPFDDANIVNVVVHHLQKDVTTLDSSYDFVDDRLKKVVLKLLTKDPDFRYQDVAEVAADLGLSQSLFSRRTGICGREKEMAELDRGSASAVSDVVALTGHEGAGKTTLLDAWKLRLQTSGRATTMVSFSPQSGLENLRTLLNHLSFETDTSDEHPGILAWIRGAGAWPFPGDHESAITSSLAAVAIDLLRKRNNPLALLVDASVSDSDWDVGFLKELSRRWTGCTSAGSVLGMTLRPDQDVGKIIVIPVADFSKTDVSRLIQFWLDSEAIPDEAVDWAVGNSGGKAAILEPAISEALISGALTKTGPVWRWYPEKAPATIRSVREINALRWQRLDEPARRVLMALSLSPRPLDEAWLDTLAGGHDKRATLWSLETLGIVRHEEAGYSIGNADLKSLAYESIPPEEKKAQHARLAAGTESAHPEDVETLAFHYARSVSGAKAIPYLKQAADKALQNHLLREAAQWCEQAVVILRAENQPADLFEWLLKLEDVLDDLGHRHSQEGVIQEAVAIAEALGREDFVVRARLREARRLERQSSFEEAQRICQTILPVALRQAPQWAGPIHRQLGKTYYSRSMLPEAERSYRAAYEAAREMPDATLQMEALNSLGTIAASQGKYAEAARHFEEALALAQRMNAADTQINAWFNLGLMAEKEGHAESALNYYKAARPLITATRNKKAEQKYFQYAALSHFSMQHYESALEEYEAFRQLSIELDDRQSVVRAKVKEGLIRDRLGQHEEACQLMQESVLESKSFSNAEQTAIYQLYLAELHLNAGHFSSVLEPLSDALKYFHEDSAWKLEAEFVLLRSAIETDFVLAGEEKLREQLGDWNHWTEHLPAHGTFYDIVGRTLMARAWLRMGDVSKALSDAQHAIGALRSEPHLDVDRPDIGFHVYEILKAAAAARSEQSEALKTAYESMKRIENDIKKSDFKTAYASKRLHKRLVAAYQEFFSEERETDIRSFEQLYHIVGQINSVLDVSELFDRIMDAAIRHSQADRGLIILKTGDENEFEIRVARNMDRASLEDIGNISKSIVQDVFESGRPLATADANTDDRFRERKSIVAYQIRSVMCVPLRVRDTMIGAVYLDKRFDTNYFGPSQLRFLESFANLAGLALENARLYEKLADEKKTLERENIELRTEIGGRYEKHPIIGQGKAMRAIYRLIESASTNSATVLIEGESGTGKELVARAIHFNGSRRKKPFVAVDCGALPENLLESELFGYKKGAFTGATADKTGLFEEADTGTIFLDEVTNTSINFQARLLRVLQEGEIRRVGDTITRPIDVRVIAATNQSLKDLMARGLFREDLYYRLNVIPIQLPSLRERTEDIPRLVEYFVQKHATEAGKKTVSLSAELINALARFDWPGNVRQLENVIQRMLVFASSDTLTLNDLPAEMTPPGESDPTIKGRVLRIEKNAGPSPIPEPATLEELESRLTALETAFFRRLLDSVQGNKSKAADQLGIKRTTLNDRLKKLGLL